MFGPTLQISLLWFFQRADCSLHCRLTLFLIDAIVQRGWVETQYPLGRNQRMVGTQQLRQNFIWSCLWMLQEMFSSFISLKYSCDIPCVTDSVKSHQSKMWSICDKHSHCSARKHEVYLVAETFVRTVPMEPLYHGALELLHCYHLSVIVWK